MITMMIHAALDLTSDVLDRLFVKYIAPESVTPAWLLTDERRLFKASSSSRT